MVNLNLSHWTGDIHFPEEADKILGEVERTIKASTSRDQSDSKTSLCINIAWMVQKLQMIFYKMLELQWLGGDMMQIYPYCF
jgi:hypothetical protein